MQTLKFTIEVREPSSGLLHVTGEIPSELLGEPEWFMPVWTPGSYLVREYSRHIEGFGAQGDDGRELSWRKQGKNRFRVEVDDSAWIRIHYRVYAHELTVRTADLTDVRAFWNGACVLLWPVGGEQLRADVEVITPSSWSLSCSLAEPVATLAPDIRSVVGSTRSHRLRPSSLAELVDSPCLAGRPDVLEFSVLGRRHWYVLDGLNGIPTHPNLIADTTRVIEAAASIFDQELPYGDYLFQVLFTDTGRGGLEHSDGSVLLAPRTTFQPRKSYEDFMGLVAHEYFHLWNIKRMRPVELWDIDLERENYTTLLWVAEGFTSYYDDLLCLRAGVLSRDRYLAVLADNIADCLRTPGRLQQPLAISSYDTWIKFYRPDENSRNSSQSYYLGGSIASLCLDLEIRVATNGERCLDDAVRDLYRETYCKGRGYTIEDVVACLSRAANRDLSPLVTSLVDQPLNPDLSQVLGQVGIELKLDLGTAAYLGLQFKSDELVVTQVQSDGPAHHAGVMPSDEILGVNGLRATISNLAQILECFKPGEPLRFIVSRRGTIIEVAIAPSYNPVATASLRLRSDATPLQEHLRNGWLRLSQP